MAGKDNRPEIRFGGYSDEWERRELGEIMEISSAARVHKEQWTEAGVPFFRTSDVVAAFKILEICRKLVVYYY